MYLNRELHDGKLYDGKLHDRELYDGKLYDRELYDVHDLIFDDDDRDGTGGLGPPCPRVALGPRHR